MSEDLLKSDLGGIEIVQTYDADKISLPEPIYWSGRRRDGRDIYNRTLDPFTFPSHVS